MLETYRHAGCCLVVAALGGCLSTTRTVPLAAYLDDHPNVSAEDKARWAEWAPGKRVLLSPAAADCGVLRAPSLGELERGGTPLAATPDFPLPNVYAILDSRVHWAADTSYLALEVGGKSGQRSWIKVPPNTEHRCVTVPTPALESAAASASALSAGQSFVFAPWRASCGEIQAIGQAPAAMLLELDPGSPHQVVASELGGGDANDWTGDKWLELVRPWVYFDNRSLAVRRDVVDACFAPTGSAEAQPPSDVVGRLRVDRSRCTVDSGGTHLVCRSSVGVWAGSLGERQLALRLKRRTLGPVHFVNGRLVKGAAFASTVVRLSKGTLRDPRAAELYQVLDREIADVVGRDAEGEVRIALGDDPGVTHFVTVDVGELKIGELERTETTETTRYKVRDETKSNPKKPEAQQRVQTAEQKLNDQERDYQQAINEWNENKRIAVQKCHEVANSITDANQRQIANTACDAAQIAGQFVQPSHDGVEAARAELDRSRSELANTPDTITEPVMDDWHFKKTNYSRSVSGSVTLAMRAKGDAQDSTTVLPLTYAWSDYAVESDPPHNVQGHAADQGPIRDPAALIPFIAQQAASAVAVHLRTAIARAAIQQAVKAFLAAGNEPPRPGWEAVDALAFRTVGPRLRRLVLRGEAALAAKGPPFDLPTRAAVLEPGECLLAVAVAAREEPMDVVSRTPDGSHGDLRGGRSALVEVCPEELPGGDRFIKSLELVSQSGGPVRWGLYRTRGSDAPLPASSSTPPAAQPAPPPAAAPPAAPNSPSRP
jgi:hypothetical protein